MESWLRKHISALIPDWFGDAVAIEAKRGSVLPVLIPPAVLFPVLVFSVAHFFVRGSGALRDTEQLQIGVQLLSAAIVTAVAIQAFSAIAGERMRRTLETFALTPLGGAAMVAFKGAAAFAAQAIAIAVCLLLIIASGLIHGDSLAQISVDLVAFAVSLLLAFILGVSFSLSARSPLWAGGSAGLSMLVLHPAGMFAVEFILLQRARPGISIGSPHIASPVGWILVFAAVPALVFRNLVPRLANAVLAIGVAAVATGLFFALGVYRTREIWDESSVEQALNFVFAYWRIGVAETLRSTAAKLVLACVLAVGIPIGFSTALTGLAGRGGGVK
jgi:hypothetical protein